MTDNRPYHICDILNVNIDEAFNWRDKIFIINRNGEIKQVFLSSNNTKNIYPITSELAFEIINHAYEIEVFKPSFNEGEKYILKAFEAKWISRDTDIWEDTVDLWYEKPTLEDGVYSTEKYPKGHIATLPSKLFPTIADGELREVNLNV